MKTEKKTGAQRTQRAVTDEWWSDERVQTFLDVQTQDGVAEDYHALLKAYRGMVPEAFERFIEFFVQDGRNLNEPGPEGRSILAVMEQHRNAGDYIRILKQAGATP
jgi:hypothetical protein